MLSELSGGLAGTGKVKVLVVMDRKKNILSEGLLSMLADLKNAEITTTFSQRSLDLQRKVKAFQPDVVILFNNRFSEGHLEFGKILCNGKQGMRVLIVDKEENSFFLLEKKQIVITNKSDFFDSMQAASSHLVTDF